MEHRAKMLTESIHDSLPKCPALLALQNFALICYAVASTSGCYHYKITINKSAPKLTNQAE